MSSFLCNSGVGRAGQGSFCPPLQASPAWGEVGWLSDALPQGCGVPHCCPPPPHPRARRGCKTRGRRGKDLTRWVGAELQLAAPLGAAGCAAGPALAGRLREAEMPTVGLASPSPAKPPKKTPGCPITAAQRPCGGGHVPPLPQSGWRSRQRSGSPGLIGARCFLNQKS